MKKLAILLLLCSCSAGVPAAFERPPEPGVARLWADLVPGEYAVGYRELGTTGISAWYPSAAEGTQLRYRDYVPLLEDVDAFLHAQKISDQTIVDLLDSRMYAWRDARSIAKPFPMVLIAQGSGQTAADQAVLAEFIASHGYVVVTVPGAVLTTAADIGPKAQEQAEALTRAISLVGDWANTNPNNVVVVGHSFGARAMLLYAMKHKTTALVSLDGGIGTANGIDAMKSAAWWDANRPLPALLHIYEDVDSSMKPDFTFMRSLWLKGLETERVESMHHAHFSTWGFAAAAFPEIAKATKAEVATRGEVVRAANRVLQFIAAETSHPPI